MTIRPVVVIIAVAVCIIAFPLIPQSGQFAVVRLLRDRCHYLGRRQQRGFKASSTSSPVPAPPSFPPPPPPLPPPPPPLLRPPRLPPRRRLAVRRRRSGGTVRTWFARLRGCDGGRSRLPRSPVAEEAVARPQSTLLVLLDPGCDVWLHRPQHANDGSGSSAGCSFRRAAMAKTRNFYKDSCLKQRCASRVATLQRRCVGERPDLSNKPEAGDGDGRPCSTSLSTAAPGRAQPA